MTRLGAAVAHCLGAAVITTAAHAQTPTERIEVTGSNIKRVDSETPSPVVTITREQIQRSGTRDIAELLRNIPAVSAGSQRARRPSRFAASAPRAR